MSRLTPAAIRRASWLMVGSSLAFAVMSGCTSALHGRCDWRLIAVVRAGAVFVLAWLIARQRRVPLVVWGPPTLWLRSTVGSLSMLCTFYALGHLPLAEAVTLVNAFPLWVALLAWPVLGQRPGGAVWLAVLCGVGGVALIEHPADGVRLSAASAAALAASFFTSVVMLGLHRLRRLDALAIVVHFSAVATLVCAAYALLSPGPFAPVGDRLVVTLLLTGVGLGATAGQVCMTRAFATGPPERLAVLGLLQVVFAMPSGIILGQPRPDLWALAGVVLVVGPSAWLLQRERPAVKLAVEAA